MLQLGHNINTAVCTAQNYNTWLCSSSIVSIAACTSQFILYVHINKIITQLQQKVVILIIFFVIGISSYNAHFDSCVRRWTTV